MSFDLGNAVGDFSWSPFSSSIFSAVTSDGKVNVFDLVVNKHEPLCEQKVVKRAKLTRCRFNCKENVLIVGDDRGGTNALKLSPNLRQLHIPQNHDGNMDENSVDLMKMQRDKMENLLASLRTSPMNSNGKNLN
mmetsp:Transcript_7002/g.10042  ORF Transcript_7002/g.10042 Transcript_7002/m.10042 type:complete len:134 (-) Transcript_7002:13-414(-)|eukprot:CAMPEP_0184872164 /NCGR_PEP_ID=MMETSP0580-20130426/41129_1 /TAXON_ID=1118495 /ORGANISM="Dactyliosolen fragilissimus" /LENGTH=133 /DNA_ID=CAMNT_0027374915 /DNA_START=144 /DNA_END=545 /DNA_ORIENTATION=-